MSETRQSDNNSDNACPVFNNMAGNVFSPISNM